MPYRRRGINVEVKRGGRWVLAPGGDHDTEEEAERHYQALIINIGHKQWTDYLPVGKKGSAKSGNWGHAGRPGKRGGSAPKFKGPLPSPEIYEFARRYANPTIDTMAEKNGVTREEYVQVVSDRIAERVQNEPISIRRGMRGSQGLIDDGRLKTQHEVQFASKGATFDPELRTNVEQIGLGVPRNTRMSEKPVYGYIGTEGTVPGVLSSYGGVELILKDDVKSRTTYTLGDSLYRMQMRQLTGTPVNGKPDIASWDHNHDAVFNGTWKVQYVEAQIRGGVRLSDVSKVIIHGRSTGWDQKVRSIMDGFYEAGIEVEYSADTK